MSEKQRKERVWTGVWTRLKKAGLSKAQAVAVYDEMEVVRAFRYEWIAASAEKQLEEVYADEGAGRE